jgi:CheW-like domain
MSAPEIDIAQNRAVADVPRIAFRAHRALPWFVLPQGLAMQVLIESNAVQVPNTRSWFIGVVSQRGNLIPVFDLAEWAGLSVERSEQMQVASVNAGAQASACALLCSDTPTLLYATAVAETGADETRPGIPERLAPYLSHTYQSALGPAHEFNILRWIADAAATVPATGH